jgi:ERCC4-type nuclease
MSINAIIIDSREPQWVRDLKFNDLPVTVATLKMGDVHALTSDGCLLVIERKTPDDYLNSLKEGRLMVQIVEMAAKRVAEDLNASRMTTWPYLIITGEFRLGPGGKVVTKRDTNWDWNAVMGSLLTMQEAGVFVHFCSSGEFEKAILRLGER